MKVKTDFRVVLKKHLQQRILKNSKYSLRAFARDLEMSPSRLSHVLNGRYGLSVDAGKKIAKALNLSAKDTKIFCQLIEAKHSRSMEGKSKAKELLKKEDYNYTNIDIDAFKVISDWYHIPLVELTRVKNFKYSTIWISQQLGITEEQVKNALERLIRVGLLSESNGKLITSSGFYINQLNIPSESIQEYHRQVLDKAKEALATQDTEIRDFGTLTIALRDEDIPYVKEKLKELRNYLDNELSHSNSPTHVYNICTQMYRIQAAAPISAKVIK
jgi:uncharacterized protein (TIGR02147 family)